MGRITAGMTHEVRNVLAVIRESSGLMEDLLSLVPEGTFKHREKFLSVIATIQDQVNRGVDLATQLNRFAHSMDEPVATVDLNAVSALIVALMQRFARLRQVELHSSPCPRPALCRTDPFRLQMVLAASIDFCLDGLGKGDRLSLRVSEAGAGWQLVLDSRGGDSGGVGACGPPPELKALEAPLQGLGIAMTAWLQEGRRGVSLEVSGETGRPA